MNGLQLASLFLFVLQSMIGSYAFTVVPSTPSTVTTNYPSQGRFLPVLGGSSTRVARFRQPTLLCGFLDDVQGFMKRFTTKATASHILVKGGAEAENFLEDLKMEIGDSPVKFAEAAAKHSSCPSASRGGNLGEFGPGQMVKEFDTVVFNKPIGVVHGPIKTQVRGNDSKTCL
jgi:peptidyl-prolyl cis-trans isomerase C